MVSRRLLVSQTRVTGKTLRDLNLRAKYGVQVSRILRTGLERVLCPRVHFKCVLVDGRFAYFGSANLTGAGMGAKSSLRRNFENGVWTDDPALVRAQEEQFDAVWRGEHCRRCGRKELCGDPVE